MEAVRTAIEQADQHLQRLMKTLGQCGIPADQWNSLGRAGEPIDYVRQIQMLYRTCLPPGWLKFLGKTALVSVND